MNNLLMVQSDLEITENSYEKNCNKFIKILNKALHSTVVTHFSSMDCSASQDMERH